MKFSTARLAAFALAIAVVLPSLANTAKAAEPRLAHMVFFTLKDHSSDSRSKFVASCQKYLSGHDGVVFFAVGTLAEKVEPGVGVSDFDVALHLVFENKAAGASYLKHPRHVKFVEENRSLFEKVRVFDSEVPAS
jgi:hypothetical protein